MTATLVAENARMNFLPALFSRDYFQGEMSVYGFADQLFPDYDSGYWHFYTAENGALFMAPDEERVMVSNVYNYFEGEMSAQAAGLVVTALTLNHRAWHYSEKGNIKLSEYLVHKWSLLMEFINTHPESKEILGALD